jgi:hypothetical protein
MNNRRVNREVKTYRRDLFSAIPLRLIALLILLSPIIFSQTNNQQYDLNDPRNPNCPCHKLQKQAEDEYKQLQLDNNIGNEVAMNINKININNSDNNNNDNNRKDQISNEGNDNFGAGSQKVSTGNSGARGIKKNKNWLWMIQKKRNIYRIKHSRIKKFRINNSECFHWD